MERPLYFRPHHRDTSRKIAVTVRPDVPGSPDASYLSSSLALAPGFVHLGRLHLPVFGIIATGGIVAALLLSQRTARLAGVDRDRLWDAGIFAVISAFVASRLLLAAVNMKLFLKQPLLVLAQPSLTAGGLLLAALAVGFWLRRHRLPWRKGLDAWAAPGALLAAVLQLGHFVEGTDAGMPTSLPWGVHIPGDLTFARVHPVQLYAVLFDALLCLALLQSQTSRHYQGQIAKWGIAAGSVISFLLSFFRQPFETPGGAWLDPSQEAALACIIAALALIHKPTPALTRPEAAAILEQFVQGTSGRFGHEALECFPSEDPLIMHAAERFVDVQSQFPAKPGSGRYCNQEGCDVLLHLARRLREETR